MLTDTACKNAICPADKKRLKLSDSGGLYLEVSPGGAKCWFFKYRKHGQGDKAGQLVESRMALGVYPVVSLAQARKARDAAKDTMATGIDPVQARKVDKLKTRAMQGDNRSYIERRIAYRMQEMDLTKEQAQLLASNKKRIDALLDQTKPAQKAGRGELVRLAPGTVITRDFMGKTHRVVAMSDGQFEYGGSHMLFGHHGVVHLFLLNR